MTWNFDISQAPKGYTFTETRKGKDGKEYPVQVFRAQKIIAASKCGVVTASRWIPLNERGDGGRWEGFTKDGPPIAWHPWPSHPYAEGRQP